MPKIGDCYLSRGREVNIYSNSGIRQGAVFDKP